MCIGQHLHVTVTPPLLLQVNDVFTKGDGLVVGNTTDEMPNGKLCGSQTFTYTAGFGPFKNCVKKRVSALLTLCAL